ncbi:programmed cell death 5 [Dermatophagoides pteronyssinus]|uniref:Programmed cell death protein 5 n=2 Tax=Dermatophagoides pteronyssinus TaxID=6956 RepID=A0ABQ8JNR2_DERPT|nr:programmed cell death protein 5-like [Dermatophagoides pteronyssinus]KAH9424068.1 Programmed cell death protein 5 [Dermatophagoides pteronyssinus]
MGDQELDAIRARRLQELQMQYQGKSPGSGMGGQGNMNMQEQQRAAQERQEREEDVRNTILTQILSQEARARLSTIALAKPERAKMLENILITNAQRGAIREKLSEEQLINFLEQVNEQTSKKKTVVKYDRRKTAIDDLDDEDDDID